MDFKKECPLFLFGVAVVLLWLCAGCATSDALCQAEWNEAIANDARREFLKMLGKGDLTPDHDFVSQYDFVNAQLEDLPWELHQLTVAGNEYDEYCEYVRKQHSDCNYLEFNFPNPESRRYDRVDLSTCRLIDGVFSSELVVSNGTISAVSSDFNDGFKICDIGFTDVNRDGFMDAVLLFVQEGSGSARVSGVYVLTRKQPGTKFSKVLNEKAEK